MVYTEPSSYREASEQLGELSKRLSAIREGGIYQTEDARYIALSHCREAVMASRMITTMLANVQEKQLPSDQFQNLVGVAPAQEASEKLSEASRLGLVVLYQFQIENLLKNLITSVGEDVPRGYYRIAKLIVETVTLNNSDMAFRILYTPAIIRNSFHSNGYHKDRNNTSWSIDINGCNFTFVSGEKVSCAGWGHIIHALNGVASVIEEILQTNELSSIVGLIPDQCNAPL